MTCHLTHLDGVYVIGALSPAEHAEFERHLADCAECTRAVEELAGLPDLLSRVPADAVERPGGGPPATLLPAVVHQVRRAGRRRMAAVAAVAAAGGAVLTLGGLSFSHALDIGEATPTAAPGATATVGGATGPSADTAARRWATDGDGPVTADVALTEVAWGTRLDLACTWHPAAEHGGGTTPVETGAEEVYVLVVRTRTGEVQQVGTWHPLPERTMRLTAATAAQLADIAAIEVHENGDLVATLAG
jgi:hypothetical protein